MTVLKQLLPAAAVPEQLEVRLGPWLGEHRVTSEYVERFWLPVIGPTCVLLLRRFHRDLELVPPGWEQVYNVADLSRDFGLGINISGANAPIKRSLYRLTQFRCAFWHGDKLHTATSLPPISANHLARMSSALRDAERGQVTPVPA